MTTSSADPAFPLGSTEEERAEEDGGAADRCADNDLDFNWERDLPPPALVPSLVVEAEADDIAADGAGDADLTALGNVPPPVADLAPRIFAAIFCPVSATVLVSEHGSMPPSSFRSVELAKAALDSDVPVVFVLAPPLTTRRLHSFPDESTRYEYLPLPPVVDDAAPELRREEDDCCLTSIPVPDETDDGVPRMRFSTLAFRGRSGSLPEAPCVRSADDFDGGSPARTLPEC
mmetsp:Transcript_48848/g.147180  ORF Transcript_48848/g.147180 Transcript_48848/m.147180 type:complete len:232 (+) Transcript_48848:2492-3187(+)